MFDFSGSAEDECGLDGDGRVGWLTEDGLDAGLAAKAIDRSLLTSGDAGDLRCSATYRKRAIA